MTVESMLTSLFLKRNLRRLPPTTVAATFSYRPWNTPSNNCHGRCALAYDSDERAGAAMPRCASLPSQLFKPPSISRSECARPSWQNSIATHCAQLDSPLAAYSAPVFFTSASNSRRGISLRSWLNMLHDAFKVGPLVDGSRCLATRTLHHHQMAQPPILFWTKVSQTLPSRGRLPASFACLQPPLMSNVRARA